MNILPDDSPEFEEAALNAERMGQWPEAWLSLARDKKLFHLAVPEVYGGHQRTLPELLNLFEQASFLDGSFGWTLTLGAGAGVFAAYMNPDFAQEQFASPDAFITGSGYPSGTAEKQGHSYHANGKWKYASGSPHATLFTASCILADDQNGNEDHQRILALAFFPDEVTVHKSWNSYGLKATASHNFEVSDLIVPADRSFTIHRDHLKIDEPLYRFPFEAFAFCTLAASLAGIARRFFTEASSLSGSDKASKKVISENLESFHQAWKEMRAITEDAWEQCLLGKIVTESKQKEIARAARQITAVSLKEAQKAYLQCGMSVLNESTRINRAWRDLHTASQHAFLKPHSNKKGDEMSSPSN